MATDPRLGNALLLALAAFRLQQRRQRQVPDWRYTTGLSSLLQATKTLPERSPWSLPDLDTTRGLGKLLAEARQWEEDHRHGA
jgi:hypothetical protein